jgi:hypothetical protein
MFPGFFYAVLVSFRGLADHNDVMAAAITSGRSSPLK